MMMDDMDQMARDCRFKDRVKSKTLNLLKSDKDVAETPKKDEKSEKFNKLKLIKIF
jgi:hypothetical protein